MESIRTLAGNELLAGLLAEHDELKKLREQWQDRAKLAEKRLPGWQTLEELLGHAKGVPEAGSIRAEADAVRDERRLLDSSDPVPAIHGQATALLCTCLKKAHTAVKDAFSREMKALEASANWQKLKSADQSRLLKDAGLAAPAELSVGDDTALLRELSARSLAEWNTTADALPERFRQVALAAARLLDRSAKCAFAERHAQDGRGREGVGEGNRGGLDCKAKGGSNCYQLARKFAATIWQFQRHNLKRGPTQARGRALVTLTRLCGGH